LTDSRQVLFRMSESQNSKSTSTNLLILIHLNMKVSKVRTENIVRKRITHHTNSGVREESSFATSGQRGVVSLCKGVEILLTDRLAAPVRRSGGWTRVLPISFTVTGRSGCHRWPSRHRR